MISVVLLSLLLSSIYVYALGYSYKLAGCIESLCHEGAVSYYELYLEFPVKWLLTSVSVMFSEFIEGLKLFLFKSYLDTEIEMEIKIILALSKELDIDE